jgi:hypothetical protein
MYPTNPYGVFPFEGLKIPNKKPLNTQDPNLPPDENAPWLLDYETRYEYVDFRILDQDILRLAKEAEEGEAKNLGDQYELGSSEWCLRGGSPFGTRLTENVFADSHTGGIYCYFMQTVPKRLAHKCVNSGGYFVTRFVQSVDEGETFSINPFTTEGCEALNFGFDEGWGAVLWDAYTNEAYGLEETSSAIDRRGFVFSPCFTDSPLQIDGIKKIGTWDADKNDPDLENWPPSPEIPPLEINDMFVVSVAGHTLLNGISDWEKGDWVVWDGEFFNRMVPSAKLYDCARTPDYMPWNRLLQYDSPKDGNPDVDVNSEIDNLFPITEENYEEKRILAKRFALQFDWSKQKRDLSIVKQRLWELHEFGLMRIPSWEFEKSYCAVQGEQRNNALGNNGDLIWLGWQPIKDDDLNINILCRIRWPQLRLPHLSPQKLGLPEGCSLVATELNGEQGYWTALISGDELYPIFTKTTEGSDTVYSSGQFCSIGGSINQRTVQRFIVDEKTQLLRDSGSLDEVIDINRKLPYSGKGYARISDSKLWTRIDWPSEIGPPTETGDYFEDWVPAYTYNGALVIDWYLPEYVSVSEQIIEQQQIPKRVGFRKLPNEWFLGSDNPEHWDIDYIQQHTVIGFSAEECAKLGPSKLKFPLSHIDPENPENNWSGDVFLIKRPKEVNDQGIPISFEYKFWSPIQSDADEMEERIPEIKYWADDFYCNPDKYVEIGAHRFFDPDSKGEKQFAGRPIYGHVELLNSFFIEVYTTPSDPDPAQGS